MNRFAHPAAESTPAVLPMASVGASSLPVLTADELETLIRQLQAETTTEPAAQPLPARTQQVRFAMD